MAKETRQSSGPAGQEKPTHATKEAAAGLKLLTEDENSGGHGHLGVRLRNYFLTGLIIVGPVGITIYVMWWFITLIDTWVKPLLPAQYLPETYLPFTIPGVGLIFSIFGLMVIGAFAANLFGRTLVGYGELMLSRMPVVRNVYRALKQIFETVLSQSSASFQQVGVIEYPRRGLLAIVFVSTETTGEIVVKTKSDEKMLSVFLPTTPNPTSGYLLFVPERDIILLEMSVEDAAKMVISAGLVVPEYQEKLKQLADDAKSKAKTPEPQKPAPEKPEPEKEPA